MSLRRTFTVEFEVPDGVSELDVAKKLQDVITLHLDHPYTKVRPLSQKTISIQSAKEFIEGSNGRIFSVRFVKRTTGEERYMTCRTGVKSKLSQKPDAKKKTTDFEANKLIAVFDMQANDGEGGYRSIPIEGMREILIKGEWFHVIQEIA